MEKGTRARNALRVGVAPAVLSIFLLTMSTHADYEAAVFRVSSFGGAGQCSGTSSTTNHYWTDLLEYRAWTTWNYDDVGDVRINQSVDAEDFTDNTRYVWGDDMYYDFATDWADTIFITTHGWTGCMELDPPYLDGEWQCCGDPGTGCGASYDCGTYNYSRFTMGDSLGNGCYIYTNERDASHPGNIYFGNTITGQGTGDANIFFTTSCNSIDPCVRHYGGYNDMDAGGFNTYLGFYGRHDFSTGGTDAFDAFLTDATNNQIGSEWLTHQHYPNGEASPKGDVCPMALIWGSSASNCDYMFDYGGFKDFKNTGTHTTKVMYWVGGCDPNKPGYILADRDRPELPDL